MSRDAFDEPTCHHRRHTLLSHRRRFCQSDTISSEVRTIFVASFPSVNAVCVTTSTTLDAYLNRTAQAREHLSSRTGVPNPLFLSYHQPYNPVKPFALFPGGSKSLLGLLASTQRFLRHIELDLPLQLRQEIKLCR